MGTALTAAVMMREAVRVPLEPWMAQWFAGAMVPLQAAQTPFALLGPDGGRVASVGPQETGEPDFLLPVRSRFGIWQFAAWDPVQTRVRYDTPTEVAAAAAAVLVALLGVVGFIQQQKTLALAAQRVSFVNRVSHELRTPLTNILLNLDLAAEGMSEESRGPWDYLSIVSKVSAADAFRPLADSVCPFVKA